MNKLATLKVEFIFPAHEPMPDAKMGQALEKLEEFDLEYKVNHFIRAILCECKPDELGQLIVKVRYDD